MWKKARGKSCGIYSIFVEKIPRRTNWHICRDNQFDAGNSGSVESAR